MFRKERKFRNKRLNMVFLISGASRGIGAELSRKLCQSGHRVIMLSRNRKRLDELAGGINKEGADPLAFPLVFDLNDLPELENELKDMIRSIASGLDGLVNNAGMLINKAFGDTSIKEARHLFDTNLFAPASLIRACMPFLMGSKLKHVVNVTSMGGFQGSAKFSGLSWYSASKAALGNLSECLAEEYREQGIRVNALALGSVQTEMLEEAFPGFRAPLGPEEMADFIAWFLVEGPKFFNGKILPVSVSTP